MSDEQNAGSLKSDEKAEWLESLRRHLVTAFHDRNVHSDFEQAFAGIPPERRGAKAPGQPFTLWRLLEHLRLAMLDFLDYCRKPGYIEPPFPEGYWPQEDAPPDDATWERSLHGFLEDLKAMEALIINPSTDLFAPIPGGSGRTILRQALACMDHNAYHLGQVVMLRRLLGAWPTAPSA